MRAATGGGVDLVVVAGRSSTTLTSLSLTLGSGFSFGSDFFVPGVQAGGLSAVEVEPPIANEVVLVENGADPNKSTREISFFDIEIRSPLKMAKREGHRDIVAYLKKNGAR